MGKTLTTKHVSLVQTLSNNDLGTLSKAGALLDYLTASNVQHLVFDWDLTILNVHSGGFVEPQNLSSIIEAISEDWIIFIYEALKRGFTFCIATFSDVESIEVSRQRTLQMPNTVLMKNRKELDAYFDALIAGEELVRRALRILGERRFGNENAVMPSAIVALYPENYQIDEQYEKIGLKVPMKRSKSYHIEVISRKLGILDKSKLVLFDDDPTNISDALREGYRTIFIKNDPELPRDQQGFRLTATNLSISEPTSNC